jgi:AmmeMemoRadiSam system protein A
MQGEIEHGLSLTERKILLKIARTAIELATQGKRLPQLELENYPRSLQENGATFVTLTEASSGRLRGCIGTLEAFQPLVLDVQEHAAAAALEDYRFTPVKPVEVPLLHIEISRLTPSQPLKYSDPKALSGLLRPGIDGVVLKDGDMRSTFLPQVWEQLPDPQEFLNHLCQKMGAPANLWQKKVLSVFTYQVEEFHE